MFENMTKLPIESEPLTKLPKVKYHQLSYKLNFSPVIVTMLPRHLQQWLSCSSSRRLCYSAQCAQCPPIAVRTAAPLRCPTRSAPEPTAATKSTRFGAMRANSYSIQSTPPTPSHSSVLKHNG